MLIMGIAGVFATRFMYYDRITLGQTFRDALLGGSCMAIGIHFTLNPIIINL